MKTRTTTEFRTPQSRVHEHLHNYGIPYHENPCRENPHNCEIRYPVNLSMEIHTTTELRTTEIRANEIPHNYGIPYPANPCAQFSQLWNSVPRKSVSM